MLSLRRLFLVVATSVLATAAHAQQPSSPPPRMVVELFTSQGCSSCPPADALLADLAMQPDVIAISLPVDYWDYLGWKDTLASPAYTKRQKGYSISRGDRQVYTPQAVINGVAHAVGSNRYQIEKAANTARGRAGALSLSLSVRRSETGGWIVDIPAAAQPATAQLILMAVTKKCEVAIGRGENADRKIAYTNVVRSMTSLGDWNGEARSVTIERSMLTGEDVDGFVLLAQAIAQGKPSAILGAAKGGF